MNLVKSFTPAPWLLSPRALFLVFFLSCFLPAGSRAPLATTPLDPILATPSQDEALYAHGILRMAAGEDWLTPRFLGRPLLVKPPLLQWLSATSVQLFGPNTLALRLPSILASAAVLTIVFHLTGPVGWVLLATNPFWRHRAGLLLMDDLLTLFYLLALLVLLRDPKLLRTQSAALFGLFVGLAVMTKWFAGLLPLGLLLYTRPRLPSLLPLTLSLALTALPWHLYQLATNPHWFLAEYLGVEFLSFALAAPTQASTDSHLSYYLPRLLYLLPCAAPLLLRRWHSFWLVWSAILLAAIALYSYRNTAYLAPLPPALLLCYRGWIPPLFLPLSLALFVPWPPPHPQIPLSLAFAGREVLHLDPDDQLRTSLQPGATVRYIFLTAHLPPNGALDFEKLGIARRVPDFLLHPGPAVDAVLAADLAELQQLILASPQRDFLLPQKVWFALNLATPHHDKIQLSHKIRLRSRNPAPGPRPTPIPLLAEF
ncbi:MAG: ArnT family glycosyltransferase [Acidobacteriota bacterium]